MSNPWLLAPLVLFAFLFWGSLIVTLAIEAVRLLVWLIGMVLLVVWTVLCALGFAVWWLFSPRAAMEALRQHRR